MSRDEAITRLEQLRAQTYTLETSPRLARDFWEWYLHVLEGSTKSSAQHRVKGNNSSELALSFLRNGNSRTSRACAKYCKSSVALTCQNPSRFRLLITT